MHIRSVIEIWKVSIRPENNRQKCLVLLLSFEQNTAAKVFICLPTIFIGSVLVRLCVTENKNISLVSALVMLHTTENMNINLIPLKSLQSKRRMPFIHVAI